MTEKRIYRNVELKAKHTLKSVVKSLKGRPYRLGGNGEVMGSPFDCFGMLVEYCRLRYSYDLLNNSKIKSHNVSTYKKSYTCSHIIAQNEFKEALCETFCLVNKHYMMPGHLVWFSLEDKEFLGIYCGNQTALVTSKETGCTMIGTEHYKIEKVFRCLLLSL
jgi:hypothetical protein